MHRARWLTFLLASAPALAAQSIDELGQLRTAHDIVAMRKLVRALEETHASDPRWVLAAAEVYASQPAPDPGRARGLFTQFLELPRGARYKKLCVEHPGLVADVRRWRRALEDRRKLWLVSSPDRMKMDLRRLQTQGATARRKAGAERRKLLTVSRKIATLTKRHVEAKDPRMKRERKLAAKLSRALLAKYKK